MSTSSSPAAEPARPRAPEARSDTLARGLLRPTSLGVIAAFAAAGALLPFTLRHGAVAVRPGVGVQALVQRPSDGSTWGVAPGGGADVAPRVGDLPGEDATPVGAASGIDAAGMAIGTAPAATATTAGTPTGSSPSAPTSPTTPISGPAPAPAPSPSPAPILQVQQPTPAGPVGATVTGGSATVTAPVAGTVTVTSPVPPATPSPAPLPLP